jgi:hypothetical protein
MSTRIKLLPPTLSLSFLPPTRISFTLRLFSFPYHITLLFPHIQTATNSHTLRLQQTFLLLSQLFCFLGKCKTGPLPAITWNILVVVDCTQNILLGVRFPPWFCKRRQCPHPARLPVSFCFFLCKFFFASALSSLLLICSLCLGGLSYLWFFQHWVFALVQVVGPQKL